jgi:protein-disulfide isomerase
MNTKRIIFWTIFVVIFALIIWGLIVAMHNDSSLLTAKGIPMPVSTTENIRGPENAPVTLIEYADYQCPACRTYHPIVEKLLIEASTTVRFVARHFPLAGHRNAVVAARAAEAAGKQGKYWDMASLLFDNQPAWAKLTNSQASDIFKGYAERLGLNIVTYEADMASDEVDAKIDADKADGTKIGVNSTPTFFINGVAISSPSSYEAFKKVVDEAAQTGSN